jgi:hypothetical protein
VQVRAQRVHTLHATLSAAQEAIVLVLRQSRYLPLDDLAVHHQAVHQPDVSRSGIARLLKREGIARLEDVIPKAEGETIAPKKTFKDYEPGFLPSTSSICPRCRMRPRAATCSLPSTALCAR